MGYFFRLGIPSATRNDQYEKYQTSTSCAHPRPVLANHGDLSFMSFGDA
jgi:hypothetical protein